MIKKYCLRLYLQPSGTPSRPPWPLQTLLYPTRPPVSLPLRQNASKPPPWHLDINREQEEDDKNCHSLLGPFQSWEDYLLTMQSKAHNAHNAQCCFLAFFKTGSKVSACQVSSLSDQPFRFFHRQIQKIHPIFDFFDKEKHLAQNLGNCASSKKGLNIIKSKMGTQ